MKITDWWKLWKVYGAIKSIGRKAKMGKYNSRKLIAVLLGAIITTLNSFFGSPLDDTIIQWLLGMISTYIVGQAVVDAAEKNAAKPTG